MPPVKKKVDVMNSVCLKISLLVLLAVMGETGSFPPAHLPFPLSSLAGCEPHDFYGCELGAGISEREPTAVTPHRDFSWGCH